MRKLHFAAAALLLACYAMAVTRGPSVSPSSSMYGDSLNLYILRALHSPEALKLDPAAAEFRSYAGRPALREYPYFQVYRLLQLAFPLDVCMRLLSLALALATALLFLKICLLALPARDAPWAALMLLTLFLSMDTFYFGQNRTFGAALCAGWFLAVLSGRGWLSPLFALALFSFYPYLSAAALAYSAVHALFERGGGRRQALAFAGLFALAGAGMLLMLPGPDAARNNAAIFAYKMTGLFGESVSPLNPLQAIGYFVLNLNEQNLLFWILQLAAIAAIFAARGGAAPADAGFMRRLKLLAAAHAAAFLALYPLSPFFASRQLIFFVPFATVLLAALALRSMGGRALAAGALCAMGTLAALHPFAGDVQDFSPYRRIYARLAPEPAALVAGPPDSRAMSGIPLYAGAAVFYNSQTAETWAGRAPGFDFSGRATEMAEALCSPDAAGLLKFATATGVTHFLAETSYYRANCLRQAAPPALTGLAPRRGAPDASDGDNDLYLVSVKELAAYAGKKI